MRRSLHGVRIAAAPGLSEDLCRALLEALEPDERAAPPDLTIEVDASDRPVPADAGGRPLFFQGTLRAWERDGAVRVADGASAIEISAGGRRITGTVHAPAGGERVFDHVLLAVGLAVALRSHRLYHLHAATLLRPDGAAVVIPGAGGSGKTTLTLALATRGFAPVADDLCFLGRDAEGPVLVPVPRAFHVAERTARAFPELAARLGGPVPSGKRELDPRRVFPGPRPRALRRPAALLFPRLGGAETAVAPRSPEAAFDALLESSALVVVDGMPGAREHLALLGELVRGSGALEVRLGEDLLADPARVAGALAAALAGGGAVG